MQTPPGGARDKSNHIEHVVFRGDEVRVDIHKPLQLDGIVNDLQDLVRAGILDDLIIAPADEDLRKITCAVEQPQKGRQLGFGRCFRRSFLLRQSSSRLSSDSVMSGSFMFCGVRCSL